MLQAEKPSQDAAAEPSALAEGQRIIREFSAGIPELPGVYMMRDVDGLVIYIGKAKNLRRRVRSYANPSSANDNKVCKLVSRVDSLSYMETSSEIEALLTESRLIKDRMPTFNRQLVQPGTIRFLRRDLSERIPRIRAVAARADDGADYLGPFWNSRPLHMAIDGICSAFRLPRCDGGPPTKPHRRCLYAQFGRCAQPCEGGDRLARYIDILGSAWKSLAGESDEGMRRLLKRRDDLIDQLRFEEAYEIHVQIKGLSNIAARCECDSVPVGAFALVAPSYVDRRPILLLFEGRRLRDRVMVAPRYPTAKSIAAKLRKLRRDGDDLLPGAVNGDDEMIIRAYLRRHKRSTAMIELPDGAPDDELAVALSRVLRDHRQAPRETDEEEAGPSDELEGPLV